MTATAIVTGGSRGLGLTVAQDLAQSYEAALQEGDLWQEFGDSHLILP